MTKCQTQSLTLAAMLAVLCAAAQAQLIDRVLAVVAATPITLSDVTAAIRFGLVPSAAAGSSEDVALNTLIDRQLQLVEVNRYVPAEPSPAQIDAQLAQIRARFDSPTAFDRALVDTGLTLDQLRANVRDTIRIQSYIQQRFGGNYEPAEDELGRYYRAHEADFMSNGALAPFDRVRQDVRRRLVAERTDTLVRSWIADLRRRSDVTVLPK
jgi:parvulin-like peptidyl-prolyl isomerase